MAIVSVQKALTGVIDSQWSVPPQSVLDQVPVPRGLFVFCGSVAIPAKLAADSTRLFFSLTFNSSFAFIQKNLDLTVFSDDQVMDFDKCAFVNYFKTVGSATIVNAELKSGGPAHHGSNLAAVQNYHPAVNSIRPIIDGDTMSIGVNVADISTDASSAGDAFFCGEFWMYDKSQLRNYPINSPLPVIAY